MHGNLNVRNQTSIAVALAVIRILLQTISWHCASHRGVRIWTEDDLLLQKYR